MSVQVSDWTGLYREGWGSRLCPASYSHPAKAAYALTVRIYEHALEEGWVKPGDYVIDCFAGIGGFALEAMRHGLHFVGVELEQRFVDMGQGCDCTGIDKEDWVRFQGRWDKARYQDGRHWCPECIMKAGMVMDEREFKPLPLPGTKWAMLAKTRQATLFDAAPSASYVRNSGKIPCTEAHRYHGNIETWEAQGMPGTAIIVQGDSRQLGEVLERASLCLSSPPYANSMSSEKSGIDWSQCHREDGTLRDMSQEPAHVRRPGAGGEMRYSDSPANLGNLPDTGFEAALTISSPVYISNTASDDPDKRGGLYRDPKRRGDKALTATYSEDEAQLAQMPEGDLALAISSPPWQESEGSMTRNFSEWHDEQVRLGKMDGNIRGAHATPQDGYGTAPGQLAALSEGDHAEACERPAIAISSPPYIGTPISAQGADGESQEWNKAYREYQRTGDHAKFQAQMTEKCDKAGYGGEQGQLAQMPPGDHAAALEAQAGAGAETGRAQACISSPPWETSVTGGEGVAERADWFRDRITPGGKVGQSVNTDYGDTAGQLGQQQGSTFWAASRLILEEVYKVLAPGGHAIFVCKRFVRAKKIVDFPLQWAHLCEAVGFKWIHHHKAWLVEDRGAQHTLEGGLEERVVKRFSFFRRLHAQKYPELAIEWEDVLCFVKE